ncbi:hypothetical protein pb186bvf_007940 [Paramecium bursaria]
MRALCRQLIIRMDGQQYCKLIYCHSQFFELLLIQTIRSSSLIYFI